MYDLSIYLIYIFAQPVSSEESWPDEFISISQDLIPSDGPGGLSGYDTKSSSSVVFSCIFRT